MKVRELTELLLKEDQDAVVLMADMRSDYEDATDLITLVRREGEVIIDASEPTNKGNEDVDA